ncbi:STAS domain-containing protein [Streptomyces sp. NPDC048507]|uniref:STAS domain-containing protein n=1 Tax=Streptomyces sp. NPDC048507 TaxID=3365560 RepID=UPI003723E5E2
MKAPTKAISAPILPAAGRPDALTAPTPAATAPAASAPPDPVPRIRSTLRDGVLAVSLAGEFDLHTCSPLRGLLDEAAARGARRLLLDAALVTFCDSSLLDVLDAWVRAGRSWETATTSPSLRLLLDLAARVLPPPAGRERVDA